MTLPIVLLAASDAAAVASHLLRLNTASRSTRFMAGVVPDEAIHRYVDGIAYGHDLMLGAFDEGGALVALAHGCVYEVGGRTRIEAAFSVDAPWRDRGLATALMAALRARAEHRGAESVVAMCLARNAAMRRVFAHCGMKVELEEGEVHARCELNACASAETQSNSRKLTA